jgi:hypothetical protein
MAAKKKVAKAAPVEESPQVVMVKITNMTNGRREVPLLDGSSIHLGAWHNKKLAHISKPIEKSALPPVVFKMAQRGTVAIEEVK